ncbi:putative quinol monooxygenase [Burkholderia sp. S171]|uniref:putative quinol monooxygenase n=1 Tax=Burkholderia sp. S171 TaxID=1641860 RepID=UPI00131B29A5|nr:antibiotic biosynthesis monooxygenase [Burkholderia sp. S171]
MLKKTSSAIICMVYLLYADEAMAQQQVQQYVVTYVEVSPAKKLAAETLLVRYAEYGRDQRGATRFEFQAERGVPNHYVIWQVWNSADDYLNYRNESTTRAWLSQLQPLLAAPLDDRLGAPL